MGIASEWLDLNVQLVMFAARRPREMTKERNCTEACKAGHNYCSEFSISCSVSMETVLEQTSFPASLLIRALVRVRRVIWVGIVFQHLVVDVYGVATSHPQLDEVSLCVRF